jgi:DNA (cytosine-5)-methyltransferase 1
MNIDTPPPVFDSMGPHQIFHTFLEFFAGGGMVRAGLGSSWRCLLANDIDFKKAESYRVNWGPDNLIVKDIADINASKLPGRPDLAWASFPCQDLSLAGNYSGLNGKRSGTFWPFWELMRALITEDRGPRVIALENVCGALTSHSGRDFAAIASAFSEAGYRYGAMTIDARLWLPQSRPRLFIIGIRGDLHIPTELHNGPSGAWHSRALIKVHALISRTAQSHWVWWNLPLPPKRSATFTDLLEDPPESVDWNSNAETDYLMSLMNALHREKLRKALELTSRRPNLRIVGGVYRRTRDGQQRAEIRFDDLAGCLRTPVGGSSRQAVVVVEGGKLRSRLLSPREAARLMGLPDTYILPKSYNQAYHLCGDGVAAPIVRHLSAHIFEPILAANARQAVAAAEAA